jgi:hypothetical protein
MKYYFFLVQNINVAQKIKEAPDNGYQIGILIGSYLPFVVLVLLAYWTYYRAKNKKE